MIVWPIGIRIPAPAACKMRAKSTMEKLLEMAAMSISKKMLMINFVMLFGGFIAILNQTLLTPALPSIMRDGRRTAHYKTNHSHPHTAILSGNGQQHDSLAHRH